MHDLLRQTQAIFDEGDAAVIRDLLTESCPPLPDVNLRKECEFTERTMGLNVSESPIMNRPKKELARLRFITWLARSSVTIPRLRALWGRLRRTRKCGQLRPAVSELDARLMQDIGLGPEDIRRELSRRQSRPSNDFW
jgi:uncharacterized protein YjiS (DUF1127 family)